VSNTAPIHYSIAILGAGPGGLSAAARAARLGLSHVLLEKGEIGNTIFDYQLRKHVMAEPQRLPLRSEIDFAAGTREQILDVWNQQAQELSINVEKGEVKRLEKKGDIFEIVYDKGVVTAEKVVLAIGMQGSPRLLQAKGANLPHVVYTLSDPDAFQGKHIVVVGAGDAAIENALALSEKNMVALVNRSGEFARAKDANVALILEAINARKIRCLYDSQIDQVAPDSITIATPHEDVTIPCDRVIVRIGCVMPRDFLEKCGIGFSHPGPAASPVVSDSYESTVPGLYIIGALIGYPLIKQAMNQGYEVIEHIRGAPIVPADQPMVEERLQLLTGSVEEKLRFLRGAMPLFEELSEPQLRELVLESTLHLKRAGEIIFEKNDYTDTFFSVISGSVDIEISAEKRKSLKAGQFFGEMGLISGRRRTATVRAAEDGIFLESPRKQILKLMSSSDTVKAKIDREFLFRALQTSIFQESDPALLASLLDRIKFRRFKRGDVIFREGDIGDELFVLRKGSVKISRKNREGQDVVQTYIAAGNYFGEMALLSEDSMQRSATVTAVVPCEVVTLSKDDFLHVIKANPREYERFIGVARARRVENVVVNQNTAQGQLLDFLFTQGVTDAENFLVIDSDRCVSCDNCEAACAATHGGYSRLDRTGGKSFASIQIPISCRHCENPLCMVDCPPDALSRQPNGEVIIRDSCIGCGNCTRNCPYGVIQMVYERPRSGFFSLRSLLGGKGAKEKGPAKAAKCDMCHHLEGGPACVRSCPTGAALRVNPSAFLSIMKGKEA
jgi:thioredoxin reductase/CRP-like cAMP-binding protein/Fe-S-cluster-containing hydrogenase component 2